MRLQLRNCLTLALARAWFLILLVGGLSACSALPLANTPINYSNPPSAGQSLTLAQRFFACKDSRGARYMASTGFMPASCQRLTPADIAVFRVKSVTLVDLPEGNMWQVELSGPEGVLFMPLPWHDWA